MSRKVIFLLTMLSLISLSAYCQPYTVSYEVKGLTDGKAYLLAIHGYSFTAVDSCKVEKGSMMFHFPTNAPTGVYRLSFGDSLYTDVVFNQENISMSNRLDYLNNSLEVLNSRENEIYQYYSRQAGILHDTIDMIAYEGNILFAASGHVITPELDSMRQKAKEMNDKMIALADSLMAISDGLFVKKLIQAYQTPDYYKYLKSPGAKPYSSRLDFLRDHYFDNIDLNDSRLLNSEILYQSITDYINTFGDPPSAGNYNRAIDSVLKFLSPSADMYNYALLLLVNTFENSTWEQVFLHLAENYLKADQCAIEGAEEFIQKAETIEKLQPGNMAPPISMKDVNGKVQSLQDVDAKLTLVFFWGSECEHCHQVFPGLLGLYEKYHSKGLEIYAVSVDTDEKAWRDFLAQNPFPWINVCDFEGILSESLKEYNTWYTPGFFLLDQEKKILGHPTLVMQIEAGLKQFLGD